MSSNETFSFKDLDVSAFTVNDTSKAPNNTSSGPNQLGRWAGIKYKSKTPYVMTPTLRCGGIKKWTKENGGEDFTMDLKFDVENENTLNKFKAINDQMKKSFISHKSTLLNGKIPPDEALAYAIGDIYKQDTDESSGKAYPPTVKIKLKKLTNDSFEGFYKTKMGVFNSKKEPVKYDTNSIDQILPRNSKVKAIIQISHYHISSDQRKISPIIKLTELMIVQAGYTSIGNNTAIKERPACSLMMDDDLPVTASADSDNEEEDVDFE